jgi:hypothetical protein
MKRRLSILLLAAALLLTPGTASAYRLRMGEGTNTLVLAAGETLPSETLLVAQHLDVQGKAERDLWLVASLSVRFGGQADGDLRVLARSAVLAGSTSQNLLAYAGGLQLATSSVVRGQAALFGTTVICEGRVEGDAWIVAQSVTLGGQWDGNVRVQAEEIRVVPGTVIAGALVYTAPKAPVLDPTVSIGGGLEARATLLPDTRAFSPAATQARFLFHGYLFLAALLVGMPFVGFFPLLAGGAVRNLRTAPWRVLLAGLLTVLAGPLLAGFAVMTVVGIPLAVMLAALYLLLVYLSHIVVALWLGHLLLRTPGPQSFGQVLSALAAGLFVLYVATALPGVASFIALPVVVLGAGALVTARLPRHLVAVPRPPPLPPVKQPPSPDQPES